MKQLKRGGQYLYERNELYYVDPKSAQNYYSEAQKFTEWVTAELGNIEARDAIRKNKKIKEFENDTSKIFAIDNNNNPDDIESDFNQHRIEVIKGTIQDNLNYVITAYANSAGADKETSYNFRLPEINPDEWVRIASNICMVPFVQGMPAGTKYYNNYTVVQSTTNKFFANPENIYYVADNDDYYHKIDCPHLHGENITGFSAYTFQEFYVDISDGPNEKQGRTYYFRHKERPCYYCIVSSSYDSECGRDEKEKLRINKLSPDKQIAYYTAVAREKYRQYTTTNYFGDANKS